MVVTLFPTRAFMPEKGIIPCTKITKDQVWVEVIANSGVNVEATLAAMDPTLLSRKVRNYYSTEGPTADEACDSIVKSLLRKESISTNEKTIR